jgi:hypothetical protein
MYLGGLNREYIEFVSTTFLPYLPKEVALAATPCVRDVPALSVAVTGAVMAPTIPEPKPLKNPLAPSSLVFYMGFVTMPVTPETSSLTPPFTP